MTKMQKTLVNIQNLEKEANTISLIVYNEKTRNLPKYKAALSETLKKLDEEKTAALNCIQAIDDPLIRHIMELRYLQGFSAEDIARTTYYSQRTVWRYLKKGEALCNKIAEQEGE